MTTRVAAVQELRKDFEKVKQAMMPVPTHPEHAQPAPGGMPGQPPVDPAQQQAMAAQPQPGAPVDPAAQQGMAGPPPADQPPAIPPEMAAILDKVISTVEGQARASEQKSLAQEQRIAKLEQELMADKQMREERRKMIDSVMPALTV